MIVGFLAALALPVAAEDVTALSVKQESADTSIEVSQIQSIKYSDSSMIVCMKDGDALSFSLDEIVVMEFSQREAVVNALLEKHMVGETYIVADIKGKIVAKGIVGADKKPAIPSVPGIYILTMGKKSKKILIK